MPRLARYCLMIMCVLALMGSSTMSFAASLATPCTHNHGSSTEPHKHHGAGCLSCCLGACVAIPDLPRTAAVALPFWVRSVAYWEREFSLPGRSIPPDLGPPRTTI
jgi:hypothetical protein